jgi:hypothetical protein
MTWLFKLSTVAMLSIGCPVAAQADFNVYMLKAYKKLSDPRSGRLHLGYHLGRYYTRNLNYGSEVGAIKAAKNAEKPWTMCNAAVAETLIEAINEYAAHNVGWSPQSVISSELWNRKGFTGIRTHLFSESLLEYPPLEEIYKNSPKDIPASLRTDIDKMHSQESMAKAFEKLGIGRRINFSDAKPGDVISFDRTNDSIAGPRPGAGHSVVFLGFLDRSQNLRSEYSEATVVGFRYFSAQGSESDGGLGERSAYFRGFCPLRVGYHLPEDKSKVGCADRVDNPAKRAKSPFEKPGEKTDCCVNRTGVYGPRVGRVLAPGSWTFAAKHADLSKEYAGLQARIKEFVRNRENASIRVGLIARGAVVLQERNSTAASNFIGLVEKRFGVDLRTIDREKIAPPITPALANQITRYAPGSVIAAANRRVTLSDKRLIEERVVAAQNAAITKIEQAANEGVPNSRLHAVTE